MTIKEFVKKNQGNYIKIGFGCAFVYADFANENTLDILKKEEEFYKKRYKDLIKMHATRIKNSKEKLEKYKKEPNGDILIKEVKKTIKSSKTALEKYENLLKNLKSFEECNITDIYSSRYDGAIICISNDNPKVEGKYWDISDVRPNYKFIPKHQDFYDRDVYMGLAGAIIKTACYDLLDAFLDDVRYSENGEITGYRYSCGKQECCTQECLNFFTSNEYTSLFGRHDPQFYVSAILGAEIFIKDKDGSATILWAPGMGPCNDIPKDRDGNEYSGTIIRLPEGYKKLVKEHCRKMNPDWFKETVGKDISAKEYLARKTEIVIS